MRPHQPTPTPDMKGDNRRQRTTRPLQSPRRRPHPQTPTPHMKGDNGRQDHFRAQEADHTNQHQGGQIQSCIKNPRSKLIGKKRIRAADPDSFIGDTETVLVDASLRELLAFRGWSGWETVTMYRHFARLGWPMQVVCVVACLNLS